MTRLDAQAGIGWTACELIEQVPGKVSGRPIVRSPIREGLDAHLRTEPYRANHCNRGLVLR